MPSSPAICGCRAQLLPGVLLPTVNNQVLNGLELLNFHLIYEKARKSSFLHDLAFERKPQRRQDDQLQTNHCEDRDLAMDYTVWALIHPEELC